MNNLSITTSIITGCLILGGFYYATQINRQNSVEKQNSFNNCMRSYSSEMEEFLNEIFRLSPVNLCNKGYDYSAYINLGRETRDEAMSLYAEPNDYIIRDDWSNLIRNRLGMPKLRKLN